jgi:hypothetical protein
MSLEAQRIDGGDVINRLEAVNYDEDRILFENEFGRMVYIKGRFVMFNAHLEEVRSAVDWFTAADIFNKLQHNNRSVLA